MARLRLGDELWSITQDGPRLVLVAGEKESVRKFISADHAKVQYDKLVADKLAAGWQPTADAPAPIRTAGEPREPGLEAAIVADPYDVSAYAVYGDWYQSRQHPRGELIALQLAAENAAVDAGQRKLGAAAQKHLARYKAELIGDLDGHEDAAEESPFHWRFGFIHGLQIELELSQHAGELIGDVGRHPSGRFLAEVVLRAASDEHLAAALDALVPVAPTMRVLSIASADSLDALEPVAQLDHLRELTVKSHGLEPARPEALAAIAQVPRTLERLHIRLDAPEQPWTALAPLFARTDLALRQLAIRTSFVDAALAELVASPIAKTLEVLDIALTDVDSGIAAFLAKRDRFPALRQINVSFERLVPKVLTALRAEVKRVRDVRLDAEDRLFQVGEDDPRYDEIEE